MGLQDIFMYKGMKIEILPNICTEIWLTELFSGKINIIMTVTSTEN